MSDEHKYEVQCTDARHPEVNGRVLNRVICLGCPWWHDGKQEMTRDQLRHIGRQHVYNTSGVFGD